MDLSNFVENLYKVKSVAEKGARPCELFKFCRKSCQRPVFSLSVWQHMHKIINVWKFWLNIGHWKFVREQWTRSNEKTKAPDTIDILFTIISIKTYLVTNKGELPLKLRSFGEKLSFHSIKDWPEGFFRHYIKAPKFAHHWCLIFHYSLATSMTNWAQMFTGLLFYA